MAELSEVSGRGRNWRERAKKAAADRLVRLAYRLDPTRPTTTTDGHSYKIEISGIPLAAIEPGMLRDIRKHGR